MVDDDICASNVRACAILLAPIAAHAEASKTSWEAFRKLHPYHLQVVCLSRPAADGSRTLIVSEPPPHATHEGIVACLGAPPTAIGVEQRRVGYDGWVRDLVATLQPMSDRQVAELIDELHDYLFGTTYKAEALELPLTPLPGGVNKLDLDVSALELQAWSLDPKEAFRPVEGGTACPLREILASRCPGRLPEPVQEGPGRLVSAQGHPPRRPPGPRPAVRRRFRPGPRGHRH